MSTFQDVAEHLEEVERGAREALGHLEAFRRAEAQFGEMGTGQRDKAIAVQKALDADDCAICQAFDGSQRADPEPEADGDGA